MSSEQKELLAKWRLERLLSLVESLNLEFPVSEISTTTGYSEPIISLYLNGKQKVSTNFLKSFCDHYDFDFEKEFEEPNTGSLLRRNKAIGRQEDEGLIHVPIAAQAGYTHRYSDPVFIGQLKRWKIPDFPYKGDKYRIFEVEGDSMAYTDDNGHTHGLIPGMEVVAERVEQEDWVHTTQWYIHVVVFEDYLVIKRLYREKGNKTFVLISDNPDYPQRRVKIDDIKEIWIMKRYLGWNTPPPRRYEINV